MSPWIIVLLIGVYFLVLIGISFLTGKDDSNAAFFVGKRQSPWYVVSFGMIGASLSGVTFISVPGWVATSQFSYMQMVLGYLLGYIVIAFVLLPLYYRMNLTSIYSFLEQRFGNSAYKTGATYFLISRTIGASFRLYLVAMVLQLAVFEPLGMQVHFAVPVILTVLLIWIYTFRSGIKTIIWTDTLQTLFMLLAVIITVIMIGSNLNWGIGELIEKVAASDYSKVWFFEDINDKRFFWKQFLAGAFITITMTGLDQDMMQKNLSCKTVGESQKNMLWFAAVLVFVNLLFLGLGALLYLFAEVKGIPIPIKGDELFPMLAVGGYLGIGVTIFFVLGLIAAAYSSADSALTALTTSFCVDFLGFEKKEISNQKQVRRWVHIGFSALLIIVILIFNALTDKSVIDELFTIAGYTYGPLLGMFAFGIFHKKAVKGIWVPLVCVLAPVACYFLKEYSPQLFSGYQIGFELLIINGALTYLGFWGISKKQA